MGLFTSSWIAIRTEGRTRSERIDQIEAILKSNGIKTKITDEGNGMRRAHVKKKELEKASQLIIGID